MRLTTTLAALFLAATLTTGYTITSVTPTSDNRATLSYIDPIGYLRVQGGAPHKGPVDEIIWTDCGWFWCGGADIRQGDSWFSGRW